MYSLSSKYYVNAILFKEECLKTVSHLAIFVLFLCWEMICFVSERIHSSVDKDSERRSPECFPSSGGLDMRFVLKNWFTLFFFKVFLSPSEVEGKICWLSLWDAFVSSGAGVQTTDRVNPGIVGIERLAKLICLRTDVF